jgi:hypothetical protein
VTKLTYGAAAAVAVGHHHLAGRFVLKLDAAAESAAVDVESGVDVVESFAVVEDAAAAAAAVAAAAVVAAAACAVLTWIPVPVSSR